MKKIWFIVLSILTLVTLAGCQEITTNQESVEMDSFTFELYDLDGNQLINENIDFPVNEEFSLINLINDQVELDYEVFPFGTFIHGIGGYYPKEYNVSFNYFYGLFVDDVSTTTGLEEVQVTNGMKITFREVTVLDETDLLVDQKIDLFIKNHLANYINDQEVQYYVMLALRQLEAKGYQVPAIPSLFEESPILLRDTIGNAFKTSITERALGLSLATTYTYLSSQEATNPYEALSLIQGLIVTNGSLSEINMIAEFIMDNDPSFMDSDYAAMAIAALSVINIESLSHTVDVDKVSSYILEKLGYIKENLTVDGIESWGNANSATTATVLIALASLGLDPRSEEFTTDEKDLVEAILSYEIDGAYKYLLTDTEANLSFSTPQAFAALVAYKIYRNDYYKPPFNMFLLPTRSS
jgi:hypothetical protein